MWKDRYHRRWQQVPTNTTALVRLIFGILGVTALPVIGSLIAIITGYMARGEISRSSDGIGGRGLATAGIVLGYIGVGLAVLGLCVLGVAVAMFAVRSSTNTRSMLLPLLLAA